MAWTRGRCGRFQGQSCNHTRRTWSQFDELQIPSLVAYEGGRPIAFGADALEHAGADGVFIAKWFKLQ